MKPAQWWTVQPDPNSDGWVVTNGKRRHKYAPDKDLEAQAHANRLNQVTEGGTQ